MRERKERIADDDLKHARRSDATSILRCHYCWEYSSFVGESAHERQAIQRPVSETGIIAESL